MKRSDELIERSRYAASLFVDGQERRVEVPRETVVRLQHVEDSGQRDLHRLPGAAGPATPKGSR